MLINESNVSKLLEKYYEILQNPQPSEEDRNFIRYYELELAIAFLKDFDREFCKRFAKILLSYCSTQNETNKNMHIDFYQPRLY